MQKHQKDYNNAFNTISTLRSLSSNLEIEKAENFENWLNIEEIAINIELADSTEKDSIVLANADFLTNLAENNNQKGQIKAQLMLENAGIAQFDEYTPLPGDNEMENKTVVKQNTISSIDNTKQDLLYIYPNPVKDMLTVEYALLTNTSVNTLSIYNVDGKLLISIPIKEQLGIEKINVTSLEKGNYFISFGTNGINSFSKKFIVQ